MPNSLARRALRAARLGPVAARRGRGRRGDKGWEGRGLVSGPRARRRAGGLGGTGSRCLLPRSYDISLESRHDLGLYVAKDVVH